MVEFSLMHMISTTTTTAINHPSSPSTQQPTIKYILMNRNDQLTSDRICGILFQYNECSEKKDHISFVIEMRPQQVNINIRNCMDTTSTFLDGDDDDTNLIDSSYCLINGKLNEQPMEQQQQQHKSVPPLVIGHLSDFHYDRYYAPGSSSNCQDFICCRNTSIVSVPMIHFSS